MIERRFRLARLKYADKSRAYNQHWTNFSFHCTVATDANITDTPVPPGGDTDRKINMAMAGVSQLVFEYLIALVSEFKALKRNSKKHSLTYWHSALYIGTSLQSNITAVWSTTVTC